MVIFHSYVKLPEGIIGALMFGSANKTVTMTNKNLDTVQEFYHRVMNLGPENRAPMGNPASLDQANVGFTSTRQ
jgi:hypothetical protein